MTATSNGEILAEIRTLLALERNYLAEERTALAEFRTGLALALIGPSSSTILAYVFTLLPVKQDIPYELAIFAFLVILTVIGLWTVFRSRSKLKRIGELRGRLKDREATVIRSSKVAHDLLGDLVLLDDG